VLVASAPRRIVLTIRLDEAELHRIDIVAADDGRTRAETIRRLNKPTAPVLAA
jgi:Ribbon-helix-helix protein, copG family